ncbi:MAG TPA: PTS sugar transporter subunit IIB [Anaerovoracaceae bacterium]|nr:PTS sugar transporter subunit IIB [Anaerovoracaceae bacterium]
MKKALVLCRTGMGSSMMLRIKLESVIKKNNFPLILEHDVASGANPKDADLIITMQDLVDDFKDSGVYVIGVRDIMNTDYMEQELKKYFGSL